MNKVTIAAINGSCNGGGTEISACFDFRYMINDRDFTIGQPEGLVGIIPGGGGTQRISRLIGKAHALNWMLTCHQLLPEEARAIGLITDHFAHDEFNERIQAIADRLSRRLPVAVTGIKRSVDKGLEASRCHGFSIEMVESIRCFADKETQAAMSIYSEILREKVDLPKSPEIGISRIMDILDSDHFGYDVQLLLHQKNPKQR